MTSQQEEAREREYADLGRFIASYSRVTAALGHLVAFLDSREPYAAGMIVSIVPNESRLIQLCKSFAPRHFEGDELAQLLALLKEAQEAFELRNAVAHTTWLDLPSADGSLMTSKTQIPTDKQPFVGTLRTYPLGFLRAKAARLDEIAKALQESGAMAATRAGRWYGLP